MSNNIVSNASPLIALSAIGKADLLAEVFSTVLVPPAVQREVQAGNQSLPRKAAIMHALKSKWVEFVPAPINPMVRVLRDRLGAGEAEAIALAMERKLPVLIDDLPARKSAADLNLDVTGTLGVLARAKLNGAIREVKPLI